MENESDNKKVILDIDPILPLIGEFGRYQRFLDVIICLIRVPLTFHNLIMYFVTLNPRWKCVVNSTTCLLNGTMPSDDDRRCSMQRNEWEYTEARGYSLVTQFDIHCDNEWIMNLTHSSYFIGWGIGAVLLGWIADKYGRKTVLFPCISIILVVGFCTAFMPNVYLVIACRFVIGFVIPGSSLQLFIINSEIVSSRHRAFAGIIVFITDPIGISLLILKAYFIRDWKLLTILCTAPYIFVLAFYKIIPESVRWLQQQGKSDDAMRIIRRIAHWNKKELPQNIELSSREYLKNRKVNPLAIFRTRKVVLTTVLQGFMWFATSSCFFCLYLAADQLGGSIYRDQFILTITEIPSVFFSIYFMNRFGRKRAALISLLFGGGGCLAVGLIPTGPTCLKVVRLFLGIVGKFSIAIAFNVLYTWAVELFPTNIRAEVMGFMQIAARLGSISSPWIAKGMYRWSKAAPFIVMGVPSLISAALGMFLPETKSKKLLNTAEESQGNSTIMPNEII